MKATVVYFVGDSQQEMDIAGERITGQSYPDGRARLVVHRGGKRVRVVQLLQAWVIDWEYGDA